MSSRRSTAMLAMAFAVVLLGSACSHLPSFGAKATTTPSAAGSPSGPALAKANGKLDAEVPLPPSFPSDVPVYKNARLTAAATFESTGQQSWGMEWETVDGYQTVANFYYYEGFYNGDWQRSIASNAATSFSLYIGRKSNPHVTGTLTINNDGALTKILLSLVSTT